MQTKTHLCKTPGSPFAGITYNVKYGWSRCVSMALRLFTTLLIMLITSCYSVVAPILFFVLYGKNGTIKRLPRKQIRDSERCSEKEMDNLCAFLQLDISP